MFGIDLTWIMAAFGGLGVAGFVALMIFAPTAAAAAGTLIAKIASSRAGMVALALGGGILMGDVYRATYDRTSCDARVAALNTTWQTKTDKLQADWRSSIDKARIAFNDAKQALDVKVKAEIEAANAKREAQMQQAEQDWQQKFDAYKKTVATDPHCIVRPEDLQ